MKDSTFLINNNIDVNSSLELLGDMDTFNEIITEFVNTFEGKINDLKNCLDKHDMANYAIAVHSLKSDAKYVGMKELADKAYDHELKSKEGDEGYVLSHINDLLQTALRYDNVAKDYLGMSDSKLYEMPTDEVVEAQRALLIADDSSIIRNIAQKMLGDKYKILQAQDGEEAIKLADSNLGVLEGLLLDLNMPNVDGFQVLAHFKDNDLFAKIPVVIITGDDSKETIMKAFDYPIVDVLAKPFNEQDVNRVLDSMKLKKID